MEFVDMPVLQVLLLSIFFLCLFVEVKTGGMGAGILTGLVAAGVFFGSQYVKGLVSLYQIAIFFVGIVCILIEMLLPTVGLLAGVGVAAMLYSVVLALGGDLNAVYAMGISFLLAVGIFAVIVNRLPSSKLWSRLVLRDASTSEKGFVSAESQDSLVGQMGEVLTELRPAGSALLEGRPVDVVSEGAYVEKGERIRVISVNGSRVVVRKVQGE